MSDSVLTGAERKAEIRKIAFASRKNQEGKDDLSRKIMATFVSQPEYQSAATVMYYVDVRAEVRTRHDLPDALASGKKIVVPWCNDDGELELFHLESMDELEIGMYKILEPRQDLRSLGQKRCPELVSIHVAVVLAWVRAITTSAYNMPARMPH